MKMVRPNLNTGLMTNSIGHVHVHLVINQGWQLAGPCRVYTPAPIQPIDLGIRILSGPIRDLKGQVHARLSPEPTQFGVERSGTDPGFKSGTR